MIILKECLEAGSLLKKLNVFLPIIIKNLLDASKILANN